MTTQSITSGQSKQIVRFGSDAIEKALQEFGLDKDGAQRVIEHGGDFSSAMYAATLAALKELSVSDRFKDEEASSNFTYPPEYKVKPVAEQTGILRQLFPGLGDADVKVANQPLPTDVEGWFAIPRWEKIASTYNQAVELVLAKITSQRKFNNWREGQLGPRHLRQNERMEAMFREIGDQQKGDILVVPAQFGLRHRGRSVRRAREVLTVNEFGLGAFAVGCMLLTHPEREVRWDQLHIDCMGDEYAPDADGVFSYSLYFRWHGGGLRFAYYWAVSASRAFGSASGFLG